MIQRTLLALATALLACSAHAQTFTFTGGGSVAPLVTLAAGHTVGGLDVDSSGNLYYLDVNNSAPDTRLMRRATDGSVTDVFDLGSAFSSRPIFGSYVRLEGPNVYLAYGSGTTSTATVVSLSPTGQSTGSVSAPLNTAAYDLAFSPAGVAYLSANPNGFNPGNQVYQVDLAKGTLTPRVSVTNDFSGPIAFTASGDLLYGTTGFGSPAGGIYRIPAAKLSGSAVTLDSSYLLQANSGNAYFAEGAGTLYQTQFTTSLTAYEGDGTGAAFDVGDVSAGLSLTNLAYGDGEVYVYASDFGNGNFIFAIPEPGCGWLLLTGAGLFLSRRRR